MFEFSRQDSNQDFLLLVTSKLSLKKCLFVEARRGSAGSPDALLLLFTLSGLWPRPIEGVGVAVIKLMMGTSILVSVMMGVEGVRTRVGACLRVGVVGVALAGGVWGGVTSPVLGLQALKMSIKLD